MKQIPLNFMTLFADLAQNARRSSLEHGSVVIRKRRGKQYAYVVSKDGATRRDRYLGAVEDPTTQEEMRRLSNATEQARSLRSTVSLLKQAKIPAPALPLGRVLETVANAGLFDRGAVLVGTAAYQTYPCAVGYYLPSTALMTNDADLLVASLVASNETIDLESVLKRADPTFQALMARDDKLPKVFRAANGFQVDIVTKFGRGRASPVLVDELQCSAEPLTFMEYLAEESIETVVLYGTGVLVRVPPPMRYAIHKLLIAQERRGIGLAKKQKDLKQAQDLIDILSETDSYALEDAITKARARGPSWKKNIDASLREIGHASRQAKLPISLPPVSKVTSRTAKKRSTKAIAKKRPAPKRRLPSKRTST